MLHEELPLSDIPNFAHIFLPQKSTLLYRDRLDQLSRLQYVLYRLCHIINIHFQFMRDLAPSTLGRRFIGLDLRVPHWVAAIGGYLLCMRAMIWKRDIFPSFGKVIPSATDIE